MDGLPKSSFLDEKDFQQAQIYARELHDLYRAELKRREELAEEKLVLEHKLRELTSLNILFQSHLRERMRVEEAYRELLKGLKMLLSEATSQSWAEKVKKLLAEAEGRISHPGE